MRADGRMRRFTLDAYPAMWLAAAREAAWTLRQEVKAGRDPVRKGREHELKAAAEAAQVTLGEVVERYAELNLRPKLRIAARRERQLRAAIGRCLEAPAAELARAHVQAAIDAKEGRGFIGGANRPGTGAGPVSAPDAVRLASHPRRARTPRVRSHGALGAGDEH